MDLIYNNNSNNNNNNNNKKKGLSTGDRCHTRWFSMGHCMYKIEY